MIQADYCQKLVGNIFTEHAGKYQVSISWALCAHTLDSVTSYNTQHKITYTFGVNTAKNQTLAEYLISNHVQSL